MGTYVGSLDSTITARDFLPFNVRRSWSDSPRVTDNLIVFVFEIPPKVAQESWFPEVCL